MTWLKKFVIAINLSILPFMLALCVIRLSNGLEPFVSLRDFKVSLETYNPPHATEYLLANNFLDSDYSWSNNADGHGGGFSGGSSFGGGGGGSRSRGPAGDTSNSKYDFSGLDISDLATVPIAIVIDLGYHVYFVLHVVFILAGGTF